LRAETTKKTPIYPMSAISNKRIKIKTMEELSSTIGVSRPTLSKFFQDPESVRVSTRARIEQALDSVDYTPNFFATKMNRKLTRLIGLIVPYLNDLFFTSLTQELEVCALRSDYMVIVQNAHGDPKLLARAAKNLISMSADGVIVAPTGHTSSLEPIKRLKEELPIVFVDSRIPNHFDDVDFVGTDNTQSISLMVDYLHRSGESPVFLGTLPMNSNSVEREEAYCNRACALGFEPIVIPNTITTKNWSFEDQAFNTMDEHFGSGNYINSTILCANDRLAIGAMRAANRHNLLLPDERDKSKCRIAGHDDHPLSAFVYPALTTVSQNISKIAETAIAQIIDQVENGRRSGPGVIRVFDAELRVRESA